MRSFPLTSGIVVAALLIATAAVAEDVAWDHVRVTSLAAALHVNVDGLRDELCRKALVLEAGSAGEFAASFERLRQRPREAAAMRRAARSTALRYTWPRIIERLLLPRREALQEQQPLGILPS